MSNFYEDVIKKDPRFNTLNVVDDVGLLEPEFRAKVEAFKSFAEHQGHVLKVIETYRSQRRQALLFTRGATQLRHVGVHGYGLAIDFALYINGVYDPKGQDYLCFADIAKRAGIISGIDWGTPKQKHSFRDYDHIQGVPVFRQTALFAGAWYPPSGYNPTTDALAHGFA